MAEQVTSKMLEIFDSISGTWKSYPIFQGRSAYESYLKLTIDNPKKSEAEWLASLQGKDGIIGKDGKSAYQSYLDTTTDSPKKSESEWLASLQGKDGANGKSAYQSYLDTTTDNPKKTEAEWISSLEGDVGPKGDPGIIEYTEGAPVPEGTLVRIVDINEPFQIVSDDIADYSITPEKLSMEVKNHLDKIDADIIRALSGIGGNLICFGDSVLQGAMNGNFSFVDLIRLSGRFDNVYKFGYGGTCVAKGDLNFISNIQYRGDLISNCDYLLFSSYGGNDCSQYTTEQVGSMSTLADANTYYGALYAAIKSIQAINPYIRIVMYDNLDQDLINIAYRIMNPTTADILLLMAKANLDIMGYFRLPVISYKTRGVNIENSLLYTAADRVHPNMEGHYGIAEQILAEFPYKKATSVRRLPAPDPTESFTVDGYTFVSKASVIEDLGTKSITIIGNSEAGEHAVSYAVSNFDPTKTYSITFTENQVESYHFEPWIFVINSLDDTDIIYSQTGGSGIITFTGRIAIYINFIAAGENGRVRYSDISLNLVS